MLGPFGLIGFGILLILAGLLLVEKSKKYSATIPTGIYPFWFFGGMSLVSGIIMLFW